MHCYPFEEQVHWEVFEDTKDRKHSTQGNSLTLALWLRLEYPASWKTHRVHLLHSDQGREDCCCRVLKMIPFIRTHLQKYNHRTTYQHLCCNRDSPEECRENDTTRLRPHLYTWWLIDKHLYTSSQGYQKHEQDQNHQALTHHHD